MPGRNRGLALLARSGYAARGVVYLIIGGLAVVAASGQGGQTTDTHGALTSLLTQPFGKVLLAIVALGLVAFGVYSLIEARCRRIKPAAPSPGLTRFPPARSGPSTAAVRTAPPRRRAGAGLHASARPGSGNRGSRARSRW